ncbi:hypothetical protein ACGFYY_38510 [Streptomyces sp. NPDC048331]|uniref:hypothetical protein n=1 Tax=Streptomyces sp. NPDC048331 TaxID=3365534 RepID=UPI00371347B3
MSFGSATMAVKRLVRSTSAAIADGLGMGLLATGAAVYLSLVHPSTAGPLGVGATVLGALAGAGGAIARAIRHCR